MSPLRRFVPEGVGAVSTLFISFISSEQVNPARLDRAGLFRFSPSDKPDLIFPCEGHN